MRPAHVAAAGVIGLLAVGTVVVATGPAQPLSVTERTVPTSVPPTEGRSIPTRAPSSTATATTIGIRQVVVEGASAWGRFAARGDLSEVEPFFDRDGPQFRQFESESSIVRDGPPYEVVLDVLSVRRVDTWAVVEADVEFVRTGGASRSFQWRFALRNGPDGWRIWTVEVIDQSSVPSSSP